MSEVTQTVIQQSNQEAPEFVISFASEVVQQWHNFIHLIEQLPGGLIILNYIKASHKNDPWRTLLEVLLALLALRYFLASKYSQDDKEKVVLSKKEIDDLIDDWEPEPVVQPLRKDERWQLQAIPQVEGPITKHLDLVDPVTKQLIPNVLNFASRDYLDMSQNPIVKENAIKVIKHVGVGACSAPNFYGTQDVHIRVCEDLARFLGAEQGIIYGQNFSTPTSVLPCFLKRGDIVIIDGGVSLALQKAALISRCNIEWYNHNDLDHLEDILESLEDVLKEGNPLKRKFILTEGLFENFGDSPDLERLIEIKNKYKFRLILDESYSIGTLGANGRGLPELADIPRSEIEITMGTMANAFGSSGGFCVGCKDMIYHQILSSSAYVFSASLPPYAARAASTVIQLLEDSESSNSVNPHISPLHQNTRFIYKLFKNSNKLDGLVALRSKDYSAILHLRLHPQLRKLLNLPEGYGGPGSAVTKALRNGHEEGFFDAKFNTENYILQVIIDKALESKVLITRSKRILHHELLPVVPELLIHMNAGFTKAEIEYGFKATESAIVDTLTGLNIQKFNQIGESLSF